ncbi:uncharacterized protein LAESUDRAFT_515360 [Laetiporus sulphureus 93-53]|uniref:Uncharacterized protein n=1 Tax=Laetiporus sulphureus 93-53 TaxID=1314785 RepID=A0A165G0C7_9APHY|nr:uncharacterized protein LAESUDRAFT_515360 [Laetiporus sulphureus 93-53]KZT09658.1 hypothetical protein LAESUDRAFT_515360 [Laetiporus sulphureus 93-53]
MPPSEFLELASGTNRSNAVAIVRVRHPELDHTKMDDTELLYWGRYHIAFNGTFHDWLAMMKSKFKYGDSITDSEAMEEVRQHAKAVLDQSIPIIGVSALCLASFIPLILEQSAPTRARRARRPLSLSAECELRRPYLGQRHGSLSYVLPRFRRQTYVAAHPNSPVMPPLQSSNTRSILVATFSPWEG